MATQLSDYLLERLDKSGVPKSKRKLQKHLRSAGLAYISRTGKVIPAKEVAAELCQCPHKCDVNVPLEARRRLFEHFYGLGEADLQNQFLRRHMDLRARLHAPEAAAGAPRRITCKYLVPLLPAAETVEVCQKAFVSAFVITTKRVRLQREKLIASLGLNSYSSHNRSKISNNNNNTTTSNKNSASPTPEHNNNTIVEKRVDKKPPPPLVPKLKIKLPPVCEKMDLDEPNQPKITMTSWTKNHSKRTVDNPLIPFGLIVPEGVTICPVIATADHDRDIAIVNNFFSNQLWKPEYIGAYS